MRNRFGYTVAILMTLLIFAAGCSKKDSNPSSPADTGTQTPPPVPNVIFNGPVSSSQNPMLMLVNGYVKSMNLFLNYSSLFANVQATYDNGIWSRKFLNGTLTMTLNATPQQDGSFLWKLTVSGTSDSVSYNNWLALEGTTSADGKTGNWKLFANNSQLLQGEYAWKQNPDGSLTGSVNAFDNSGKLITRTELTNNSDKTGQVLFYLGQTLSFKALWDANGGGQWWQYGLDGNPLHQGTWS
ncbi:MAG: hypothetical protein ACM3S2_09420 [Ignavibacteriales bacterium]